MQQGVRYKQENIGLADNFTSFIGEVNPDVLLIGTNSGLSLFNTRTNRCYNYNHNNGLSISSARSGCILRRANGDIVIGGIDGVETLTPSQVEFSDDSIDIAFDRLIVNNGGSTRVFPTTDSRFCNKNCHSRRNSYCSTAREISRWNWLRSTSKKSIRLLRIHTRRL